MNIELINFRKNIIELNNIEESNKSQNGTTFIKNREILIVYRTKRQLQNVNIQMNIKH